MSVFVQDTARNTLIPWVKKGVTDGYVRGAVLSPFTSPPEANGFKKSAVDTSDAIREAGGEFWFDPTTHGLDMPRAGDFRFYDDWELWPEVRGDLSSHALRSGHIARVFDHQRRLSSPLLAPTTLVSYPDSQRSQLALTLSRDAVDIDQGAWLTVAGDAEFWQAGAELDAHVGALDQLEPAGWMLVVARSENAMPPAASAEEVFGLMRTTFALSQDRPVWVAFGDLAAVPALAVGASGVGTGWDMRQRICAYQDFEERLANGAGGGSWYQRPSLERLMGSLKQGDFQVLRSENQRFQEAITPGTIGPKPQEAFVHHARVLVSLANALETGTVRERCVELRERYLEARENWPRVQAITGTATGASRWVDPFRAGTEMFMESEGWL